MTSCAVAYSGPPLLSCLFLEEGEFIAAGFRRFPYTTHFFCRGCGRDYAQVLVESPTEDGHCVVCGHCRSCYERSPWPEFHATLLQDFGHRDEPVDIPVEVYKRDFLLVASRFLPTE